jgi:hypothetical protein
MFDWLKKQRAGRPETTSDDRAARQRGRDVSGKYWSLYQYLEHRYSDTVVLTFAQIEDLLGCTLPARARTDPEWWKPADTSAAEPRHFHAWTLTRRTAKPNLLAENVVFERAHEY